jgi:hypothetical protein
MALPAKFRNVHYYRIAGKYCFAGDLFVCRGKLYFFPEVDLEQQRSEVIEKLPHHFALLALAIIYLGQQLTGAYMSRIEFWQEGISDEQFQNAVAAHIERLKLERSRAGFGQTLPLPMEVEAKEIADMKLTVTGKLSFCAQSDKHDFNFGLFKKTRLRNALWEAGLSRV